MDGAAVRNNRESDNSTIDSRSSASSGVTTTARLVYDTGTISSTGSLITAVSAADDASSLFSDDSWYGTWNSSQWNRQNNFTVPAENGSSLGDSRYGTGNSSQLTWDSRYGTWNINDLDQFSGINQDTATGSNQDPATGSTLEVLRHFEEHDRSTEDLRTPSVTNVGGVEADLAALLTSADNNSNSMRNPEIIPRNEYSNTMPSNGNSITHQQRFGTFPRGVPNIRSWETDNMDEQRASTLPRGTSRPAEYRNSTDYRTTDSNGSADDMPRTSPYSTTGIEANGYESFGLHTDNGGAPFSGDVEQGYSATLPRGRSGRKTEIGTDELHHTGTLPRNMFGRSRPARPITDPSIGGARQRTTETPEQRSHNVGEQNLAGIADNSSMASPSRDAESEYGTPWQIFPNYEGEGNNSQQGEHGTNHTEEAIAQHGTGALNQSTDYADSRRPMEGSRPFLEVGNLTLPRSQRSRQNMNEPRDMTRENRELNRSATLPSRRGRIKTSSFLPLDS